MRNESSKTKQTKRLSTSRVVFMCGPAGSGKSTYAKKLELQGMERLSFDKESYKRGIIEHPLPKEIHEEIENFLIQRLITLIEEKKDVVLDYSFWSRAMRDKYRSIVKPYGIEPEVIYIDTPKDIILERIRNRKGKDSNDIKLSEESASQYYDHFEVPTSSEGQLIVVKGY